MSALTLCLWTQSFLKQLFISVGSCVQWYNLSAEQFTCYDRRLISSPPSWCQRCPGRLVPRSAETPLVKGCIENVVEKIRNVTALSKYTPISLKFRLPVPWCVLSSAAYSLNWTIPLMMTNRPWYTRRYASLHGGAVFPFESARARQMSWRKLHSGERFVKCLTKGLFFDSSSSYAGTNDPLKWIFGAP